MEEKTKNIILPIVAILLGIIVGGCTQVKAETIPITYIGVSTGLEQVGGNKEFKWLYYQDAPIVGEWNNGMYRYWDMSLTPTSLIPGSYNEIYVNMEIVYKSKSRNSYFKDMNICYNNTCVTGVIQEAVIEQTTEKDSDGYYHRRSVIGLRGVYKLRNYDSSITYFSINFKSENTIETITAFIRDFPLIKTLTNEEAEIESNKQDAQAQINAQKEEFNKLINSGEFNKPNKDTALEDLEDDESLLQDILGIPNYNDLNIEINESATEVIWDLIIRVLNQNTAILTMVITILSISILKLIMNR